MTLADVFAVLLALALAGFGFIAFAKLAPLVAPELVSRSSSRLARHPATTLVWGAALFLSSFLAIVTLLQVPFPPVRLSAVGLFLTGLTLAAIGAVALAREVGERLGGGLRKGALVLGLASLLPVIGWFVVLPAAFLLSLGAGCLAPFGRSSASNVAAPAVGPAA